MKTFCLARSCFGAEVIIASVLFPSSRTHAAELGFNELHLKRTDAARATRVRGGQGNGAQARAGATSEEHIGSAWVWRPNPGWRCISTSSLVLLLQGPHGLHCNLRAPAHCSWLTSSSGGVLLGANCSPWVCGFWWMGT